MIEKNSISIIVPMYNSEKTINMVIDSLIQQTYKDYIREIIVVNDGSSDTSLEIVNKRKEEASIPIVVLDKPNGGVSSARNLGIKKASGKWIAFCDSDDIWLPKKIEYQVRTINGLKNNVDIDLIGGNHTNKDLRVLFRKIKKIHRASGRELCIKMYPQTSTILMKKNIFDQIGGFDESQKYAEDGNYFIKIAFAYRYYYIPKQLVVYDGGKRGFGSSGLSSNLYEMHKGNLKNIKEFCSIGLISTMEYCLLSFYYRIKYIRRVLIVKTGRKK